MSETAAEATQDGNTSGATSAADEFKAPASQEELNRIIAERVKRVEAKYADYKDVKTKAEQLDKLSEASKSEQDKLTDRITSLENEIEATRLAASRAEIAREFSLTEQQAAALKYAPSEEAAREIAQGLASDTSTRKSQGNRVPAEGTSTRPAQTEDSVFARDLFAG
jgi:hypothetical protein